MRNGIRVRPHRHGLVAAVSWRKEHEFRRGSTRAINLFSSHGFPGRLFPSSSAAHPMSLISIVITLIVVGFLLWVINSYIPMDSKIKSILNVVVVIVVIFWLLHGFGIIGNGGDIRMPEIK